jgi:hypothetical protein
MAAALAAGDRQAVAQVYDVYGARLYSYAYELVADRARAADAVRDAITVAAYRADELVDTESLGAWLFALVRVECARDGFAEDVAQDAASGIRGDRLARVALDCYALFSPERRELLDLAFRHRLVDEDMARLMSMAPADVARQVGSAQDGLEFAMTAAFAHRDGVPDCEEMAHLGAAFDEVDGRRFDAWVESVSRHGARCPICSGYVRDARPLQYFEALPLTIVPPGVRGHVLDQLRDPGYADACRAIAARAGAFDEDGFPLQDVRHEKQRRRGLALPIFGVAAAVVAIAGLGYAFIGSPGKEHQAPVNVSTTSNMSSSPASDFSSFSSPPATSPTALSTPKPSTSSSSASSSPPPEPVQQQPTQPQPTHTTSKPKPPTTPPTHTAPPTTSAPPTTPPTSPSSPPTSGGTPQSGTASVSPSVKASASSQPVTETPSQSSP